MLVDCEIGIKELEIIARILNYMLVSCSFVGEKLQGEVEAKSS